MGGGDIHKILGIFKELLVLIISKTLKDIWFSSKN
jgi:hypothetical protein